MITSQFEIISLNDDQLIDLIHRTNSRLFIACPGLSLRVSEAIAKKWRAMSPDAVSVLVDSDPDVCRMGYGEAQSIQLLHETAADLGVCVCTRPGIRIGLFISDELALIFSPSPLLVENLPSDTPHPNAIQIAAKDLPVHLLSGLRSQAEDFMQGGETIKARTLEDLQRDLSKNPPVKFDVARRVRVFNAQFEFVEFELHGFAISRKTVAIPSYLMGLAGNPETEKLLRATFKLVGEKSAVSGQDVWKLKEQIVKKFLIVLPGYGTVVLRTNKSEFESAVEELKKFVETFQNQVREELQKEMDNNRSVLLKALASSVLKNPPNDWIRFLGSKPSEDAIFKHLDYELRKAFGSAERLVSEMKVKLSFKGVTYESLNDPNFIETVRQMLPLLELLHEEYDAAKPALDKWHGC